MGNSQVMPKVDFEREDLKTQYTFSRYLEAKNIERYTLAKRKIRNKRLTFLSCTFLAAATYSYTIYSIKQESFLDDFEEPVRVSIN